MIQKGTIRKMGQYYRNDPRYEEEILRGVIEFYGKKDVGDADQPLFNEWMMYDFKFSDGKGMLEKFYEENPMEIPLYRREIYKSLMENYYGLFEVLEVKRLQSLLLKRVNDQKIFNVSEISATLDLDVGDIFVTRVAKVIDHYELVGANTKVIKLSETKNKKERDLFIKKISSLIKIETPKDTIAFLRIISNQI